MMGRSKILFVVYIICTFPLPAAAQHFNYAAQLEAVDSDGFYSIALTPQLTSYLKTDCSDIRIADKNKNWVPHILQPGNAALIQHPFTSFPILENKITDSGNNVLILENTKEAGISSLELFLKNAAVSRTASLSGSNNRLDWFIIDDKIAIGRSFETVNDEYLQEINFPLIKYHFLKITIGNLHNDPLLITRTGCYEQPVQKNLPASQDIPDPFFIQTDSANYSFVAVTQQENYPFDKVLLQLSGSKFYSREVQICLPDYAKNNPAKPGLVLGNFNISAASPAIFEMPGVKVARFFIVIKNADNPPLKVEKIQLQQQVISLIAFLEKGNRYELMLGDSTASFADYDLQVFKDSITNVHSLHYGDIFAIKKTDIKKVEINKKQWIWFAVIAAGIALSILTYRLTGDINKLKK